MIICFLDVCKYMIYIYELWQLISKFLINNKKNSCPLGLYVNSIFWSIKKTAWNEYKKEGQTITKEKGQNITQEALKIE